MSEDSPKISLHSQLQKTKSWVTLVVGSLLSVVLIGFQAAQLLNTLATKEQVENTRNYVVTENGKLQQELEEERNKYEEAERNIKEIREVLTSHLELHAGRLAAERQPDKKKAAKAAEEARRKFREALSKGKSLEDAMAATYDPWF